MKAPYPPMIHTILQQIAGVDARRGNLDVVQSRWQDILARAAGTIPGLHIEADGEIVHLGVLSPGCQACKDGRWDCVFVTMRCNLACSFCYSPEAVPAEFAGSVFGDNPEEIVARYAELGIQGIGLTGGEPFLEVDKLTDWLERLKRLYPQAYYWVYTNGLLADDAALEKVAQYGLDEIRFNLAATGYDHPAVLRNVAAAAHRLPRVTVEIPAIPEHAPKVLECLALWADLGVRTLNLHELIYEPGTRSEHMAGERLEFFLLDGHRVVINPDSRELTLKILSLVSQQGLPLAINDCSMQSKLRQLRGRRRNIYSLLRPETEKLIEDREYESICAFTDQNVLVIHPDDYQQARMRLTGYRFVRLRRQAPLSLQKQSRWLSCEEI